MRFFTAFRRCALIAFAACSLGFATTSFAQDAVPIGYAGSDYGAVQTAEKAKPIVMDESALRQLIKTARSQVELTFHLGSLDVDVVQSGIASKATVGPDSIPVIKALADVNSQFVTYKSEMPPQGFPLDLGQIISILMLAGLVYFIYIQVKAKGGGLMGKNLTGSKAIMQPPPSARFADMAGCESAIEDLGDIVAYLRDPWKYRRLNVRVPRGVLLVGPPGTGKTMAARCTAGEANVPFYTISGSDFVEMFVGVGAGRVRSMIETAKKNAPCIIFIDEFDAMAKQRGGSNSNDEREQTLNQLLVEMDGFDTEDPHKPIIFLAATNQPDSIDKAAKRPGRFDRMVVCDLPHKAAREQQFLIEFRKFPVTTELRALAGHYAAITPGFSGASIAGAMNEAGWFCAKADRMQITPMDLDKGILKQEMGSENKPAAARMTEEEKFRLSGHEWAHLFVALRGGSKAGRVTILPRGRTGGHFQPYAKESLVSTKRELLENVTCYMAGAVAEALLFPGLDGQSSGCSSDLQEANRIARVMVTQIGMSDVLGKISISDEEAQRMSWTNPARAAVIDEEIKKIVDACEAEAHTRITASWEEYMLGVYELKRAETLLGFEAQELYDNAKAGKIEKRADPIPPPVQLPPRTGGKPQVEEVDNVVPIGRFRKALHAVAAVLPIGGTRRAASKRAAESN